MDVPRTADLSREATLRPRVRSKRGVAGERSNENLT